jgi:hypothetical protein
VERDRARSRLQAHVRFERLKLKHLGNHVRMSDDFISKLLAATDQRLGAETARFSDVYDFVARIRPWFPGVDFGRHSGPLFEVLRPLLLLTPDAIRRQIDLPDPIAPAARQRCQALVAGWMFFEDDPEVDSSDLLLVVLLPRLARIFARAASSKEPGIARIRDIAATYLKTQGKVDPDA